MLAATIMDIVYGIEITGMDDEHMKLVIEALEILGESKIPGKYWADFIPFLQYVPRWVPGAASAKFAAQSRSVVQEMIDKPFDQVKNAKVGELDSSLPAIHTNHTQLEDSEGLYHATITCQDCATTRR